MNYSYVMGVNNIDELKKREFIIQKIDDDYGVIFSDDQINFFEDYICRNLSNGFWNEHLGKEKVFIFKFEDGSVKKYHLNHSNENEILNLCRKFANYEFENIDKMLKDNDFYAKNYYRL